MKIRLNKYIANSGFCNRKDADTYIESGLVTVNKIVIKKLGYKINTTDLVKLKGRIIKSEKNRYFLLNKPKNYCFDDTTQNNSSKINLIKKFCQETVYPAYHLKKNESGLLLFTNDQNLTVKLNNNLKCIKCIFQISLKKEINETDFDDLLNDLRLKKEKKKDSICYVENESKDKIGIECMFGRLRLITNIFEDYGYQIKELDLVFLGGLTKKDLTRGKFRELLKEEVTILKRL